MTYPFLFDGHGATRALIYCAGQGRRWKGKEPKQLAEVDGETILDRIIRQCRERDIEPVVISHDERLDRPGAAMMRPNDYRFLVSTIKSTLPLVWDTPALGILGDVYFTDAAFDTIADTGGLHWFGRATESSLHGGPPEVFAIGWNVEHGKLLEHLMVQGISHAQGMGFSRDEAGTPVGSLWQPYRYAVGVPLDKHEVPEERLWVDLDDATDDPVDSQHRFARWLEATKGQR